MILQPLLKCHMKKGPLCEAVFEKCIKPFSIRVHSLKKLLQIKNNLQIHYKQAFRFTVRPRHYHNKVPFTFKFFSKSYSF